MNDRNADFGGFGAHNVARLLTATLFVLLILALLPIVIIGAPVYFAIKSNGMP